MDDNGPAWKTVYTRENFDNFNGEGFRTMNGRQETERKLMSSPDPDGVREFYRGALVSIAAFNPDPKSVTDPYVQIAAHAHAVARDALERDPNPDPRPDPKTQAAAVLAALVLANGLQNGAVF